MLMSSVHMVHGYDRKMLRIIHSGDCGHHASSRSLGAKAFRHGFYWLTAHADAKDIVRKCDEYQKYTCQAHVLARELTMIPITWLFAVWVLDMVGPFKPSSSKKTHLLVAIDKFTKWVEAKPVSNCDATTAVIFLRRSSIVLDMLIVSLLITTPIYQKEL
jgi:hypothetical protein